MEILRNQLGIGGGPAEIRCGGVAGILCTIASWGDSIVIPESKQFVQK